MKKSMQRNELRSRQIAATCNETNSSYGHARGLTPSDRSCARIAPCASGVPKLPVPLACACVDFASAPRTRTPPARRHENPTSAAHAETRAGARTLQRAHVLQYGRRRWWRRRRRQPRPRMHRDGSSPGRCRRRVRSAPQRWHSRQRERLQLLPELQPRRVHSEMHMTTWGNAYAHDHMRKYIGT